MYVIFYSDTAKSKKLESNVFFSVVHPCNDFNLQVRILSTLCYNY